MNQAVKITSTEDSNAYRIWELETALNQAIQELRDASNLCTSMDMPTTGKNFALAAERKQKVLESRHV